MSMRLVTLQLLLAFAVANARNDPPPSSDRTWSPPNLSNYESELAGQRFKNDEGSSRVSINPRKAYNLAELIDIAERNNPETRVAWERARQAAAAVGSERKRLLSIPRRICRGRLRPRLHSVSHTGGESKEAPNKSEPRRCIHYRRRFACHTRPRFTAQS